MTTHHDIFLEQARIGYINFHSLNHNKRKYQILSNRKHSQNKHFDFNNAYIDKIDEINKLLDHKLKEAYSQAERLEQYLLDEIKRENSFISDYEIEFKLDLFAEHKYSQIEDLQGNPFFEFKPSLRFWKFGHSKATEIKQHKDWLLNTNHNEFQHVEHPLKSQFHCWILHELYDHTYLSWQDIIDVEEVWFEVLVIIQNFSEIKR
jgi:hypothetical protein